jgi:hypothetical protein
VSRKLLEVDDVGALLEGRSSAADLRRAFVLAFFCDAGGVAWQLFVPVMNVLRYVAQFG